MAALADPPSTPRSARSPSAPWSPHPLAATATAEPDPPSGAADRGKRPVWNLNAPPDVGADAGSVIGAFDWPALSKSTAPVPKSSSYGVANGSAASLKGPVVSSPLKVTTNSQNPAPARQKSMRRSAAGASSSGLLPNGGSAQPVAAQTPQQNSPRGPNNLDNGGRGGGFHTPQQNSPRGPNNLDNGGRGGGFQTPQQNSPRGPNNLDNGGRGGGFQAHGGGEQNRSHGGGNRKGNNSNGGFHHGNRRDPERGGYEFNHRNFGGRDVNMHAPPLRGIRPYLRAPPPPPPPPQITAPLVPAPPMQIRPFMAPMGYTELPSPMYYVPAAAPPEALRAVPFVAHQPPPPPPMFIVDPHRAALLKQIEYYFSPTNLRKDPYLREQMDEEGWVLISLIAGFRRVHDLTANIPNKLEYILDTMRLSNIVEVQGDKIRKHIDWKDWLLPKVSNTFSNTAPRSAATPNFDSLATRFQSMGLNGVAVDRNSISQPTFTRSNSENFSSPIQSGEVNGHGSGQGASYGVGSDQSSYARSLTRSDTL